MACLNSFLGTSVKETQPIDAKVLSRSQWTAYDRHQLCIDNINSLLPIQNHVVTQNPITLLNTNKSPIKDIPEGSKLLLTDFEVVNSNGFPIYYKVNWGSEIGYISAGSHLTPQNPLSLLANESDIKFLANVGDHIRIKNSLGINQRSSIKGNLIQNIPNGAELEILKRELRGTEGRSYFFVTYKGKSGYIYGGQLNPSSVFKWTELILDTKNKQLASLKANLWYVMPRSCASEKCDKTGKALWGSKKLKASSGTAYFEVLEEKDDWIRIYSHNDNTHGWINKEVTNEF